MEPNYPGSDEKKPMPGAPSSDIHKDMLEAGEHLVTIVRKHPIGIIALYIEAVFGVIAAVALFIFVGGRSSSVFASGSIGLLLAGVVLLLTFLIFFLFVASYVYRQNRMIITDRGLIQVTQTTLFIRKVTRLSFSNVEDVSAEERGFFPTIFNYGTLLVQTAGTMDNFEFTYCPDPSSYADMIIELRQAYAESLKEEREK